MSRLTLLPRHFVLVTAALASLLVFGVGCKQDVGERCEQNSDCYSGLCTDMTQGAAAPGICEATLPTDTNDAATGSPDVGVAPVDAGTEVSVDAALESHVEAGGSDATEAGAEVHSEAGTEAGAEAGSEAGSADGASGG